MAKKVKLSKQEKWEQENEAFVNEVRGLDSKGLSDKLSTLSKNLQETEEALEEASQPGMPLYAAKQEVAQLKGPFTDSKKAIKARTKFVYRILKDRGQA